MGVEALTIAITSVAFAVTGISAKIDKAAASVFGKDLVMFADVAGAAFMAFGGMGNAAGAGGGAEVGAANAVSDANYAGADWGAMADAPGVGQAASNVGNVDSLAELAQPTVADAMQGTLNEANAIGEMGGNSGEFLEAAAKPQNVFERIDLLNDPNATQKVQDMTAGQQGTGVAAPQAAAQQGGAANSVATRPVAAGPMPNATAPAPATQPRSFFDKLIYDAKGEINPTTLRLAGGALAGYGQSAERQRMFDQQMAEERRRMNQTTGIRVTR